MAELSRDGTYGATNGLIYEEDPGVDIALPLGHPFTNLTLYDYWSSTDEGGEETDEAYAVGLSGGAVYLPPKTDLAYVWPCRGP